MLHLVFLSMLTCSPPGPLATRPPAPIQSPAPILQPHTYRSPGGNCVLSVIPSRRDGAGPGSYTLHTNGALAWEKEMPLTLWDAVLTDEGYFGGYAYSKGLSHHCAQGELHFLLFDSAGHPLLNESSPRQSSRVIHGTPFPSAGQLRLSEDGESMLVRVYDGGSYRTQNWRAYQIESGLRTADRTNPRGKAFSKRTGRAQADPLVQNSDLGEIQVSGSAPVRLMELESVALKPMEDRRISPVRHVRAFSLTGSVGYMQFIRGQRDETVHVTLDKDGEVIREQPLPNLCPARGTVDWYPLIDGDWIAGVHDYGSPAHDRLFRVDVKRGVAQEILEVRFPKLKALAATPDGGFVLLGQAGRGSSTNVLLAMNASGSVLWRKEEWPGSHRRVDGLFALSELVRTTEGYLALLSSVRTVQVFTPGGQFVRKIRLEESFGHKPRLPGDLIADERGGFCVIDDGKLWRMDIEGTLIEVLESPHTPELPFSLRRAQFDSEGNLWSPWTNMISSRDKTGARAAVFGIPPSTAEIETPRGGAILDSGQIMIGDGGSQDWHVFSSRGEAQFVLTVPAPHAPDSSWGTSPTLDRRGHFFIPLRQSRDESREGRKKLWYYEFDGEGKPLERVYLGAAEVQFTDRAGSYWSEQEYGRELVLTKAGEPHLRLKRTPAGTWFQRLAAFRLGADGRTLAVVDNGLRSPEFLPSLSVYDSEGNGLFSVALPASSACSQVAVSAHWVAVAGHKSEVLLVNLETHEVIPLELQVPGRSVRWGFSPDGRELWGVDVEGLEVHRFAMPGGVR